MIFVDDNGTYKHVPYNLIKNAEVTMKAQEDPAGSGSLPIGVNK